MTKRVLGAVLAMGLVAMPLDAQRTTATVAVGASSFDLSGTGTAPMVSLRLDHRLHSKLRLEGSVTATRPEQQFDATTTFLAPEVQLQWTPGEVGLFSDRWRLAPYLGVGSGWAWDLRPDRPDRGDPSFSGAVGLRIPVGATGSRGLEAEFRVRYLDTGFTGSSGDFSLGWYWAP